MPIFAKKRGNSSSIALFNKFKDEAENIRKEIEKNSGFIHKLHSKRVDLLQHEKSLEAKERSLNTRAKQLALKEKDLLKKELDWINHNSVLNKLYEELAVLKDQLVNEASIVKKATAVIANEVNEKFVMIKSLKEEILLERKNLNSLVQKDIKLLFQKEKDLLRFNKDIDKKLEIINETSVVESHKKHHISGAEQSVRKVSMPSHSHLADSSYDVRTIRSLIDDAKKKSDFDGFDALKSLSLADSLISKLDDESLIRELSYDVKDARTSIKLGLLK